MKTNILKSTVALFAAVYFVAVLTACTSTQAPTATERVTASRAVTVSDAWVKAADKGMSAAFGELHNNSHHAVRVVTAETSASSEVQLHNTIQDDAGNMVMKESVNGFSIPARGKFELEPGGSHIMLMDLKHPLLAGGEVSFTLRFSDGSTRSFTAHVKDFAGAKESYSGHSKNDDSQEHKADN